MSAVLYGVAILWNFGLVIELFLVVVLLLHRGRLFILIVNAVYFLELPLRVFVIVVTMERKSTVAIPNPVEIPHRIFDLGVQHTPFDDIAHARMSRNYRRYKSAVCENQMTLSEFENG